MFIKLLILFTIVPILELYVLISASHQIGIPATIAMIFLTGIAGAFLARTQGFSLINRIQDELRQGVIPKDEMVDGAMILAGGLLLLTPGFCTDLFGFCLLTPVTRQFFKKGIIAWLEKKVASGQIRINRF